MPRAFANAGKRSTSGASVRSAELTPKGLRCIGVACPNLVELDAFTEPWHTPQLCHSDVVAFAKGRPHVCVGDPDDPSHCAHGDEMRSSVSGRLVALPCEPPPVASLDWSDDKVEMREAIHHDEGRVISNRCNIAFEYWR